MRSTLLLAPVVLCVLAAAEQPAVRVLYDFEDPTELEQLRAKAESVTLDIVQDNGVTRGRSCARAVFKQGVDWGLFELGPDKTRNWAGYDYVAFDVFTEREEKLAFNVELWDKLSRNYHTRCTFEQAVRAGKQTLLYKINRARRNGKEGRDWEELEPQDRIDLNGLTKVKCFVTPPKTGGDLVWWLDNIRLLTEDAAGAKMTVKLPAGVRAFDFGAEGTHVAGFTHAPAAATYKDDRGYGFSPGVRLLNCGKSWPDPLTGDGVCASAGEPLSFELTLPDGEYHVWLSAGPLIRGDMKSPQYLLKLGATVFVEEKPTVAELHGERWLYRFMRTQYSERENALWLDFIDRMYPVFEKMVTVQGGKLSIQAQNHWLAALIVLPAAQEEDFKALSAAVRAERLRLFNSATILDPQKKPAPKEGDGPYVCFVPDDLTHFSPATAPNDAERARKSVALAGAQGQRVVFRLGLTPFEELGRCAVFVSPLKGPAEIPAKATQVYFQDYRVRGSEVHESALLQGNEVRVEKGVSWCWWFWLKIPDDAPPGDYTGTVRMETNKGKPAEFPLSLTVHPFRLADVLPVSFGMYYNSPQVPEPEQRARVTGEQLAFMRAVGFTAVSVGGPNITAVRDDGTVNVSFDTFMVEQARAAGMGRHPLQHQMANSLGGARAIARRLGQKVDQNPGCEFSHPQFKDHYLDYARKYAALLKQQGLPIAVEIVDEPREVPNPWNRNLEHTNLYGDWLHEGGVAPTFVTPMGDSQSGKDYTSLVDHADIISTHAGKGSAKLMRLTPEKKKTLWLYNIGMDRLAWGFYNWRAGSVGRWEWHFCWTEGGLDNGYPNEEWYNPFTGRSAFAPPAPYTSCPGGMLFQSVFLTCAEGITDTAYLVTLEKALADAAPDQKKADTVAKARAFLEEIKQKIPFLPDVEGLAGEDAGALVGRGLRAAAAAQCEVWRRKIAEFIVALR